MIPPNQRLQGNDFLHSSDDVEKEFTAMMDTYLDSWIPAGALLNVPSLPNSSQLQVEPPDSQLTLNGTVDVNSRAHTLPCFTAGSANDTCIDADMFGFDVADIGGQHANQGSLITALSSGDIPGGSQSEGGCCIAQPGMEGVRKQKILEKNR
jgi:hypothetical protein